MAVAVASTVEWAAGWVVFTVGWVAFTAGALLAQDFVEAGIEADIEADIEDTVAPTGGTDISSASAFPATGRITAAVGVMVTLTIIMGTLRITILPPFIRTQFLIRTQATITGLYTVRPIRPPAHKQTESRCI